MTNKPQKDAIISHWASLVAQALKNQPANAGDSGSIPGSGRYPGEGNDSRASLSLATKNWLSIKFQYWPSGDVYV